MFVYKHTETLEYIKKYKLVRAHSRPLLGATIALSFFLIFSLEMVKNGICFFFWRGEEGGGVLAKKIPFSSTNVPPKNAPMPLISRIGPACTLRKIQSYELITREF